MAWFSASQGSVPSVVSQLTRGLKVGSSKHPRQAWGLSGRASLSEGRSVESFKERTRAGRIAKLQEPGTRKLRINCPRTRLLRSFHSRIQENQIKLPPWAGFLNGSSLYPGNSWLVHWVLPLNESSSSWEPACSFLKTTWNRVSKR